MDDNSLQQPGNQPLDVASLRQIIQNRFSYDRRKMIFFTLNSCLMGLAVFSLFSAITLESNTQIFRLRTLLTKTPAITDSERSLRSACKTLETVLISQNIAQLLTIITGVIGYFGIY